jgi:hypothetical protein
MVEPWQSACRGEQLGGGGIVEELGHGTVFDGAVTGEDGVASWGVVVVLLGRAARLIASARKVAAVTGSNTAWWPPLPARTPARRGPRADTGDHVPRTRRRGVRVHVRIARDGDMPDQPSTRWRCCSVRRRRACAGIWRHQHPARPDAGVAIHVPPGRGAGDGRGPGRQPRFGLRGFYRGECDAEFAVSQPCWVEVTPVRARLRQHRQPARCRREQTVVQQETPVHPETVVDQE